MQSYRGLSWEIWCLVLLMRAPCLLFDLILIFISSVIVMDLKDACWVVRAEERKFWFDCTQTKDGMGLISMVGCEIRSLLAICNMKFRNLKGIVQWSASKVGLFFNCGRFWVQMTMARVFCCLGCYRR